MAAERHGRKAVIALAAAAAACFAVIGLLRHGNWWSGLDLGLFSQSVWHWGNLEAPLSTLKGGGNLLGDHFSPIVALLAPASWTGREPEALVVAQALLVAASILPVHSYARDRLPALPALGIAVAYAGSWLLWAGALFEFHELAFAPLLVALGILWGDRRQWGRFAVAMVLLACVKEDMGVLIVFFGIWLLANGSRQPALFTIAGGVLAYLLAVEVVIPHYGDGFDYWTYDAVGSDPLDAVAETVKQPWLPLEVALDQPEKRRLLAFLVLPFLFLPLLSRTVILAIPLVAERVLSSNQLFWETEYHYGLPLAPVLAMATAGGLATVLARLPEARRQTAATVASVALIALAAAACWAGPSVPGLVRTFAPAPGFDAAGEAAVNRVPEGESVITHDFVYPHVAARESADIFREGAASADWMILAPFAERGDATGSGSLEELSEKQIRPRLAGYGAVWERDGWIVLRRGSGAGVLDRRACARLRARARAAPPGSAPRAPWPLSAAGGRLAPMGLIASHAGLRETPGAPITDAVVADVAGRLAEHLRRAGLPQAIAVAHDGEPRAMDLAAAALRGASVAGADAVDLGAALTPVAKLAARRRGLGGALVVTGSHLGPELTGVKLAVAPDLIPLDPRELPATAPQAPRPGQVIRSQGAADEHAEAVTAAVDAAAIRAAGLTVRAPGVAGPLLERLGCAATDGDADVGLEPDADGDRLRLGAGPSPLDPEATLPLVALARRPRALVRSTETSRATELMLGEGTHVVAVPPGELHLVRALAAAGPEALAGEGNGGVVVAEVGLARDGLATAAVVLELMARSGEPLSELARRIPVLKRRRLTLDADRADEALAAASDLPGARLGDDGEVAIERGGGLWALVRRSATEPIVKVVVEGGDATAVDELFEELAERVGGRPTIAT